MKNELTELDSKENGSTKKEDKRVERMKLLYVILFPFGIWAFIWYGAFLNSVIGLHWFLSLLLTGFGMSFTLIICAGNMKTHNNNIREVKEK